jgi:type I restriction enzyme S subunit
VRLGEVLRQVWRAEPVDALKPYRLLGARWYAEGLFVREQKLGQEIAADQVYRVRTGDFVYNRLFAWKGSFAVAKTEVDGCYVSNEFPCFEVQADRLNVAFLGWWFKRGKSWTVALGLSSGATPTSRNRLKEALFLNIEIPLPSLTEQRRVVVGIDRLAAEIRVAP